MCGLKDEAAHIDESIRNVAKQGHEAVRKGKQNELLLLQHAFNAFLQQLIKHLKVTILTPPKELVADAERRDEVTAAKNYLILCQKAKDENIAKKFLFLRQVLTA